MPRDLWQKARFRDTARFASREYASGEGQSSFAYAWNDDEAIRGVKQILKLQQRSRQIPSSSPTSPGTQIPLRQRLNMLFVSKKLWSRSGLRPEAISITGIPATISRVGDNAWAWWQVSWEPCFCRRCSAGQTQCQVLFVLWVPWYHRDSQR